jgi:ubiquinone/menaquinone biosynthesis C-methylase UbiE
MKDEIVFDEAELDKYLKMIDGVFPLKNFTNNIDLKGVKRYYRESYIGYQYLHSKEGSVHLALNFDGIFDKKGFYVQADEVGELIDNSEVKNVLELGCGKGFNSVYLAPKYPKINFKGIDITDKHLSLANIKAQHIYNLDFQHGDFNEKLDFQDNSFDLIFAIEAFCYANDIKKALAEVYRILKPNGQFLLYDGYKGEKFDNLSENLKTAAMLTEKSMAVNYFEKIDTWTSTATEIGFKIKIVSDQSEPIRPNLERCQRWARRYYKNTFLSKMFIRVLPKGMIINSIAGLLMPFTVYNNAHRYYKIIIEKQEGI